jgi:hypothetical protein
MYVVDGLSPACGHRGDLVSCMLVGPLAWATAGDAPDVLVICCTCAHGYRDSAVFDLAVLGGSCWAATVNMHQVAGVVGANGKLEQWCSPNSRGSCW